MDQHKKAALSRQHKTLLPTYGPDPTGCCPGLSSPPFAGAHRETLPFSTVMLCWGFNLSHQAATACFHIARIQKKSFAVPSRREKRRDRRQWLRDKKFKGKKQGRDRRKN